MCVCAIAFQAHPEFPLILAHNRDEFRDRPTQPAHVWPEIPGLLAGRDEVAGGTWLGVSRRSRWAVITNFREGTPRRGNRSRGEIPLEYLASSDDPEKFAKRIARHGQDFGGFSAVLGTADSAVFFSNRSRELRSLGSGVYGLSNNLLDCPWDKVSRVREGMAGFIKNPQDPRRLFPLLEDRAPAPDHRLPDTGIGEEREKALSSPFVDLPTYGTRTSTLIFLGSGGEVRLWEKTHETRALRTFHHSDRL